MVPTLGASPLLGSCLEALRREGGRALEIVVVHQGGDNVALEVPGGLVDRLHRLEENEGFAGGSNRGIAMSRAPYVATVNDDVVVGEGWLDLLASALSSCPRVAAVQGINLLATDPRRVDGRGLAWNRSWQAIQLGHGEPLPAPETSSYQDIFGVSATAALYRRESLEEVAGGGDVFASGLESYYEDVDLACRLRGAGFGALLVPGARAVHAGSTTGGQMPVKRVRLIYGNRHLVLARTLGAGFWPRLPVFVARDLVDGARALARGDLITAAGIAQGLGRMATHLPRHGHLRRSCVAPAELRGAAS